MEAPLLNLISNQGRLSFQSGTVPEKRENAGSCVSRFNRNIFDSTSILIYFLKLRQRIVSLE